MVFQSAVSGAKGQIEARKAANLKISQDVTIVGTIGGNLRVRDAQGKEVVLSPSDVQIVQATQKQAREIEFGLGVVESRRVGKAQSNILETAQQKEAIKREETRVGASLLASQLSEKDFRILTQPKVTPSFSTEKSATGIGFTAKGGKEAFVPTASTVPEDILGKPASTTPSFFLGRDVDIPSKQQEQTRLAIEKQKQALIEKKAGEVPTILASALTTDPFFSVSVLKTAEFGGDLLASRVTGRRQRNFRTFQEELFGIRKQTAQGFLFGTERERAERFIVPAAFTVGGLFGISAIAGLSGIAGTAAKGLGIGLAGFQIKETIAEPTPLNIAYSALLPVGLLAPKARVFGRGLVEDFTAFKTTKGGGGARVTVSTGKEKTLKTITKTTTEKEIKQAKLKLGRSKTQVFVDIEPTVDISSKARIRGIAEFPILKKGKVVDTAKAIISGDVSGKPIKINEVLAERQAGIIQKIVEVPKKASQRSQVLVKGVVQQDETGMILRGLVKGIEIKKGKLGRQKVSKEFFTEETFRNVGEINQRDILLGGFTTISKGRGIRSRARADVGIVEQRVKIKKPKPQKATSETTEKALVFDEDSFKFLANKQLLPEAPIVERGFLRDLTQRGTKEIQDLLPRPFGESQRVITIGRETTPLLSKSVSTVVASARKDIAREISQLNKGRTPIIQKSITTKVVRKVVRKPTQGGKSVLLRTRQQEDIETPFGTPVSFPNINQFGLFNQEIASGYERVTSIFTTPKTLPREFQTVKTRVQPKIKIGAGKRIIEALMPKEKISQKTPVKIFEDIVQRQQPKTRQRQLQKLSQSLAIRARTGIKPALITEIIPVAPTTTILSFGLGSQTGFALRQQRTKPEKPFVPIYRPQIYSILAGVTAKKQPKLTGLEIRPVIIETKRKRRKK